MKLTKISLAAIAAASLVSGPVMAESLSPSASAVGNENVKRAGAKADGKRKRPSGALFGAIAAVASIGGAIALLSDKDKPASP
jgi:polygalacturonase